MSANASQTTFLARTIIASDIWNECQAKSVRRAVRSEAAEMLRATATGPAAAVAIAYIEAGRIADQPSAGGMRQLADRAEADEQVRDRALHYHEQLERSVRVLQIAIVLLRLYLAIRLSALVLGNLVIGAVVWGAVAALRLV